MIHFVEVFRQVVRAKYGYQSCCSSCNMNQRKGYVFRVKEEESFICDLCFKSAKRITDMTDLSNIENPK